MNFVARRFAWLLPLVLCACAHKTNLLQTQVLAPPLEDTPPPPPDLSPTALPSPVINVPKTKEPIAIPPEPVKTAPKHHKSSKTSAAQAGNAQTGAPQSGATAGTASNQVAETSPGEVSAMGDFKTPDTPDSKKQAENSIAEIERGLNAIGRKLNDQETKTSVQIRELLKQAREDLATGDLEAAKTLTTKAKALLGELSQ